MRALRISLLTPLLLVPDLLVLLLRPDLFDNLLALLRVPWASVGQRAAAGAVALAAKCRRKVFRRDL